MNTTRLGGHGSVVISPSGVWRGVWGVLNVTLLGVVSNFSSFYAWNIMYGNASLRAPKARSLSWLGGQRSVVISPSGVWSWVWGVLNVTLLGVVSNFSNLYAWTHTSTESAKPRTIMGSGERRNLPQQGLERSLGRFERNATRGRLKLLRFLRLKYYVRECEHRSAESAKPLTIWGSGERRNLSQRGLELGLGRFERNATRGRLKLLKFICLKAYEHRKREASHDYGVRGAS